MDMEKEKDMEKGMEKGKEKRKRAWVKWLTSPLLVVILIVVFLFRYGDNSYINRTEHQEQIDELRAEIKENVDSTLYYERKAAALNTDRENLERIAREQYGMKRENEEVYQMDIR